MMSAKITLVAGTAKLLARGGVDSKVYIKTALADLYLGDSTVTSDGATSFGLIPTTIVSFDCDGDLYGVSAAGGAVYVMSNDAVFA